MCPMAAFTLCPAAARTKCRLWVWGPETAAHCGHRRGWQVLDIHSYHVIERGADRAKRLPKRVSCALELKWRLGVWEMLGGRGETYTGDGSISIFFFCCLEQQHDIKLILCFPMSSPHFSTSTVESRGTKGLLWKSIPIYQRRVWWASFKKRKWC